MALPGGGLDAELARAQAALQAGRLAAAADALEAAAVGTAAAPVATDWARAARARAAADQAAALLQARHDSSTARLRDDQTSMCTLHLHPHGAGARGRRPRFCAAAGARLFYVRLGSLCYHFYSLPYPFPYTVGLGGARFHDRHSSGAAVACPPSVGGLSPTRRAVPCLLAQCEFAYEARRDVDMSKPCVTLPHQLVPASRVYVNAVNPQYRHTNVSANVLPRAEAYSVKCEPWLHS